MHAPETQDGTQTCHFQKAEQGTLWSFFTTSNTTEQYFYEWQSVYIRTRTHMHDMVS